ncbi:outer membrane beta-barrel protein [Rubrivirga marina]|nr:outer membrane beta-barrel protein [Rubrivirga marina]
MLRLTLALLLAAPFATSQTTSSLHIGGVDFDLSGVGQATVIDARVGHALNRYVAVEGGLGYSDTPQQFGDVRYVLPSAEVQLGVPVGPVRPFVGLGLGVFVPLEEAGERTIQRGETTLTVDVYPSTYTAATVALGADVAVVGPWIARATGRLRATGDDPFEFSGTFAELTGGVGYRF